MSRQKKSETVSRVEVDVTHLPIEWRELALKYCMGGYSRAELARQFNMTDARLRWHIKKYDLDGIRSAAVARAQKGAALVQLDELADVADLVANAAVSVNKAHVAIIKESRAIGMQLLTDLRTALDTGVQLQQVEHDGETMYMPVYGRLRGSAAEYLDKINKAMLGTIKMEREIFGLDEGGGQDDGVTYESELEKLGNNPAPPPVYDEAIEGESMVLPSDEAGTDGHAQQAQATDPTPPKGDAP